MSFILALVYEGEDVVTWPRLWAFLGLTNAFCRKDPMPDPPVHDTATTFSVSDSGAELLLQHVADEPPSLRRRLVRGA
jgi:hypothetical protein